ncbi:MAG: pyrrolo-quinoline quinone [Candidatus Sulfotelmatobacter sp.]
MSPSILQGPSDQTVTVGQSATFTSTASGQAPLTYQWMRNGSPIPKATAASYTTPATALADNASQFQVAVTNSIGEATSANAVLSVHSPPDVTTFHNDNLRTGQNLSETYLTLQNVNASRFGKIGFLTVDGKVDAQPLFLGDVPIPGQGTHNVLYVATEHDGVFAFDADTQALLWQVSVLGAGEATGDDLQCDSVKPEIGITSTPVIDRTRGPNGLIYLVAATEDSAGNTLFRMHALDVTTGAEMLGGPVEIQAQYPSLGGTATFAAPQYLNRAALLLENGVVYTSWASHCDIEPYGGWVIGYDATTLKQTSALDLTANGRWGGIWMAGDGPAADDAGNIYLLDGNGTFDDTLDASGFPSQGDFGNAVVKISPSGSLKVTDYFAPHDTVAQSAGDYDLGSGGILLLPDNVDDTGKTWHLALGSGKTGSIYIVDRDDMGKYNSSSDTAREVIPLCCPPTGGLYGPIFSTPAYFNSTVYFGAITAPIQAYAVSNGKLSTSYTMISSVHFNSFPGTTPAISANGIDSAILWAVENGTTAVLHAFDANNLSAELYNSNLMSARDQFAGNKFIVPTIANGKVYVGTPTGVAVFGLLP